MLFIVVSSNLAVCILILFIRASGNWEYCHWNATRRIIAGVSGMVLLPPNNKGRWMKHLVHELLSWRALPELYRVAFVAFPLYQSDSLLCLLLASRTKSRIPLQQFSLCAPLLMYINLAHAGSYATGDKYKETIPGHEWLQMLHPRSLGLCRAWYSPWTYCRSWRWVRSPVLAAPPCRGSFACSGISSLDSSCQPSLSPVAA